MEPIDRRTALLLGGVGFLSVTVGGVGLRRVTSSLDVVSAESFSEPEQLRSRAGLLEVRLEAASSSHVVAGRQVTTLGYNGGLPGPTLRVKPGDTLRINLVNGLEEATNLHVHGLHVSPEGNGDNVFVRVEPGQSFTYEHRLPSDHPPGTYWYHPHLHGSVADQVFGGLYGAIVVEDDLGDVSRERVMVISDINLDSDGQVRSPSDMEQRMLGREGEFVLVNGQVSPKLQAAPGDRERWRIVNACTSRYLSLALEGQEVEYAATDVGHFEATKPEGRFLLAPGNRLDLVTTLTRGRGLLRAVPFDRGSMGGMMGGGASDLPNDGELASIQVAGSSNSSAGQFSPGVEPGDLRDLRVSRRRTLSLKMSMGGSMMGAGDGSNFSFDGRPFEADRIDQSVSAGALEEWTIRNDTSMDHPFHLHVWAMQVIDPDPESAPQWRDVVNVPARSEVVVLISFDDYPGKTVYHCHILDHEDRGMMGVVRMT